MAEQRDMWRMEQLAGRCAAFSPGAPPPVLAAAASLEHLASLDSVDGAVPTPLMPVAAFTGRAVSLDLVRDGAAATMRLFDGVLRGVATERRAARVRIAGDPDLALDLALLLADELAAEVPTACLPEEAMAAARSIEPPPRHLGAPTLSADITVDAAFAVVVGHLADVMLYWGKQIAAEAGALEPVHQMRVAMRRLRSAISQFHPAVQSPLLDDTLPGLKALAKVLGPARDWDVFCSQTGQSVIEAFGTQSDVAQLLLAAERRRDMHYRDLRAFLGTSDYRRLMIRLAALSRQPAKATVEAMPTGTEGTAILAAPTDLPDASPAPPPHARGCDMVREFAAQVLDKRYRRLLVAGEAIETLDVVALHDLRLLCKRLRYNAEFFASLWPHAGAKRFIRRLAAAQEALGIRNDGSVAGKLLAELGGAGSSRAFAVGVIRGFVAGRTGLHGDDIARTWHKLRRTSPFWR